MSRKLSPGSDVTITLILSDSTLVPPVTEDLSPPASLMTGALSPVMALSSIVAKPSIISPSVAIKSPASQIKTFPFTNCDELIFLISPFSKSCFAGVSSRVFLKLSACALPLASAIASAKLANKSVANKIRKTIML